MENLKLLMYEDGFKSVFLSEASKLQRGRWFGIAALISTATEYDNGKTQQEWDIDNTNTSAAEARPMC